LQESDRLALELKALEERAGVREQHEAFVEYHGDNDLRMLYFSVPDSGLRKELIAQARRQRKHGGEFSKSLLADARQALDTLEAPGFVTPWIAPGLLASVSVWIGYSYGSIPGALAGAVVGFFIGSAYISQKRSAWRLAIRNAKAEVDAREAEVKGEYLRYPFSDTEEETGNEDEGTDPMIHLHARLDNVEGVKRELAKGVSIELENNDSWKSRPLHRAAAAGSVRVTELLVSLGADVKAKNGLHGWLPIHYAAKHGSARCIQVLLSAGSPVDTRDRYDQEPILRAAESGDPAAINVLIDAGAKVDAKADKDGLQPIHVASRAGHAKAVEALLARGADPNAENVHGARPLYFANLKRDSRHRSMSAILVTAGAGLKASSSTS
jgi:hypothetical protein